jgi:hypothetical protein
MAFSTANAHLFEASGTKKENFRCAMFLILKGRSSFAKTGSGKNVRGIETNGCISTGGQEWADGGADAKTLVRKTPFLRCHLYTK